MPTRRPRRRVRPPRAATTETVLVEEEIGRPGPPPLPTDELPPERELWPWMLVLLALVLAGLAAAYFATRDDKKSSAGVTVTTTVARTVSSAPTGATRTAAPKPAAVRPAVPNLVGRPAPAALQALRARGLTGRTRGVFSTKPRNQVVSQTPGAASRLAKGATVTLDVSKGPKAVPIPDVIGQDEAAAVGTVKAQGFVPDVAKVPSNQSVGQVVAQHPVPGTRAAPGSGVRLNVSTGAKGESDGTSTAAPTSTPAAPPAGTETAPPPASATVPDVTGKKLLAARKLIRAAGLVTGFKRVPNELPKGTVVSQSPKPGTTAKRGAHVLVNVSLGPKPKPATEGAQPLVPDVTGEDETTATQDLQAAGFQVEVVRESTADDAEDGIVVQQDPSGGVSATAKSKVTIYVGRFGG